ncbi:inositol-phosphate phosphatase, putative [Plasmodium gallinaceum]|uniref:phosphoinositide 5-phosphatase n=1 Tax=Plasmodium gallinaceum TaxID=5849 RepID=A0A1J1GZW6_PLAGA|nr:inositol-phosphate phosphatase, putative [Plasmodium gallinaceum]CRG98025.1 inositol-phosphate phosphatase, putative [Plasmodium gallinaceum]
MNAYNTEGRYLLIVYEKVFKIIYIKNLKDNKNDKIKVPSLYIYRKNGKCSEKLINKDKIRKKSRKFGSTLNELIIDNIIGSIEIKNELFLFVVEKWRLLSKFFYLNKYRSIYKIEKVHFVPYNINIVTMNTVINNSLNIDDSSTNFFISNSKNNENINKNFEIINNSFNFMYNNNILLSKENNNIEKIINVSNDTSSNLYNSNNDVDNTYKIKGDKIYNQNFSNKNNNIGNDVKIRKNSNNTEITENIEYKNKNTNNNNKKDEKNKKLLTFNSAKKWLTNQFHHKNILNIISDITNYDSKSVNENERSNSRICKENKFNNNNNNNQRKENETNANSATINENVLLMNIISDKEEYISKSNVDNDNNINCSYPNICINNVNNDENTINSLKRNVKLIDNGFYNHRNENEKSPISLKENNKGNDEENNLYDEKKQFKLRVDNNYVNNKDTDQDCYKNQIHNCYVNNTNIYINKENDYNLKKNLCNYKNEENSINDARKKSSDSKVSIHNSSEINKKDESKNSEDTIEGNIKNLINNTYFSVKNNVTLCEDNIKNEKRNSYPVNFKHSNDENIKNEEKKLNSKMDIHKILKAIQKLLTVHMYYSYDFDLTQSIQNKTRKNIEEKEVEPLSSSYNKRKSLLNICEKKFMWNYQMIKKMKNKSKIDDNWFCSLIQGYISYTSIEINRKCLELLLISRRSAVLGGTRFNKRGINDDGYVANYVETEQIIRISNKNINFADRFDQTNNSFLNSNELKKKSIKAFNPKNENQQNSLFSNSSSSSNPNEKITNIRCPNNNENISNQNDFSNNNNSNNFENRIISLVQIRGSIPLFWKQHSMSSHINIQRSSLLSIKAFKEHNKKLINNYGNNIYYINLLSQNKSNEKKLTKKMVELINYIKKDKYYKEKDFINYIEYDFHISVKNKSFEDAMNDFINKILLKEIKNVSFFIEPLRCNDNVIRTNNSYNFQNGVFRTNCLDCLDRTNVFQYYYALYFILYILHISKNENFLNPVKKSYLCFYKNVNSMFNKDNITILTTLPTENYILDLSDKYVLSKNYEFNDKSMFDDFYYVKNKKKLNEKSVGDGEELGGMEIENNKEKKKYNYEKNEREDKKRSEQTEEYVRIFKHLFKKMWVENGDIISTHYTGTGSVFSSQINVGRSSLSTNIDHAIKSIERFYQNNFEDNFRQECIDIILCSGKYNKKNDLIDKDFNYMLNYNNFSKNEKNYDLDSKQDDIFFYHNLHHNNNYKQNDNQIMMYEKNDKSEYEKYLYKIEIEKLKKKELFNDSNNQKEEIVEKDLDNFKLGKEYRNDEKEMEEKNNRDEEYEEESRNEDEEIEETEEEIDDNDDTEDSDNENEDKKYVVDNEDTDDEVEKEYLSENKRKEKTELNNKNMSDIYSKSNNSSRLNNTNETNSTTTDSIQKQRKKINNKKKVNVKGKNKVLYMNNLYKEKIYVSDINNRNACNDYINSDLINNYYIENDDSKNIKNFTKKKIINTDYEEKIIKLWIGSWNLCGSDLYELNDISSWLNEINEYVDMYVFCFQEVVELTGFRVLMNMKDKFKEKKIEQKLTQSLMEMSQRQKELFHKKKNNNNNNNNNNNINRNYNDKVDTYNKIHENNDKNIFYEPPYSNNNTKKINEETISKYDYYSNHLKHLNEHFIRENNSKSLINENKKKIDNEEQKCSNIALLDISKNCFLNDYFNNLDENSSFYSTNNNERKKSNSSLLENTFVKQKKEEKLFFKNEHIEKGKKIENIIYSNDVHEEIREIGISNGLRKNSSFLSNNIIKNNDSNLNSNIDVPFQCKIASNSNKNLNNSSRHECYYNLNEENVLGLDNNENVKNLDNILKMKNHTKIDLTTMNNEKGNHNSGKNNSYNNLKNSSDDEKINNFNYKKIQCNNDNNKSISINNMNLNNMEDIFVECNNNTNDLLNLKNNEEPFFNFNVDSGNLLNDKLKMKDFTNKYKEENMQKYNNPLQNSSNLKNTSMLLKDISSKYFLNLRKFKYVKLKSVSMIGLFIIIFIDEGLVDYIREIEVCKVKVGLKGNTGNKGSVSIKFRLGFNSFCFNNIHLASGQTNIFERNTQMQSILNNSFQNQELNNLFNFDYFFACGDFNFRINKSHEEVIKLIENNNVSQLLHYDQFIYNKLYNILPFCLFYEHPILFNPTYKYKKNSNMYDIRRTPAWCDRILVSGKLIHLSELEKKRRDKCEETIGFNENKSKRNDIMNGRDNSKSKQFINKNPDYLNNDMDNFYHNDKIYFKYLNYKTHNNFFSSDHKPVSSIIELKVFFDKKDIEYKLLNSYSMKTNDEFNNINKGSSNTSNSSNNKNNNLFDYFFSNSSGITKYTAYPISQILNYSNTINTKLKNEMNTHSFNDDTVKNSKKLDEYSHTNKKDLILNNEEKNEKIFSSKLID